MLYRLKYSDLHEIVDIDSLNRRVAVHYVECTVCASYRRVSYDKVLAHAAVSAHMKFTHNISNIDDVVKNMLYKPMAIDKEHYMELHDVIIID